MSTVDRSYASAEDRIQRLLEMPVREADRELTDPAWSADPALLATARGALAQARADPARALRAYREALRLDPDSPIAQAAVLLLSGAPDLVARLQDLHDAWPELEAPACSLVQALWMTGRDRPKAVALVEECLRLHPQSIPALMLRSNLAGGDASAARRVAGDLRGLTGRQRWSALVLWTRGHRAEAVRVLVRPDPGSGVRSRPLMALTLPIMGRPRRVRGLAVALGAVGVLGAFLLPRGTGEVLLGAGSGGCALILAGHYVSGAWEFRRRTRALERERRRLKSQGTPEPEHRTG